MNNTNNTDLIREEINNQYESVRAFSRACDIPNGTVVSALNNGIDGMAYGKVKKMCECLNIDMNTFEPIRSDNSEDEQSMRIMAYLERLPETKKEKVLEYIKDIR